MRKPLPHQSQALKWADKKRWIALHMQMRLGKSLIAIRWSQQFNLLRKLVLCPLTSVGTWQDELKAERQSSTIITGTPKQKLELLEDGSGWNITNYEALIRRVGKRYEKSPIAKVPWDLVFLDEGEQVSVPGPLVIVFLELHLTLILEELDCLQDDLLGPFIGVLAYVLFRIQQ